MAENTKMIHIRMPVSLVKELDDLIKKSSRPGSRSRFIVEAVASRLKKEHYLKAVKGLAGMLTEEEVPHWKDDEAINKWLADNRKVDRKALEDKWQM
ncbi:hypothetical protein [Neomoorella thermoacetica]|uniref:Uncharacterized protein n=2 Tax=Neomoorella thermoacetica TaxID=1525 RepID=A0AAC9HII2_NEOTH|nr:hypothetical protein [Moorella thermoacetica]AKX94312.1 hypothetical protein MOTHE_c15190 [Moorella thermoacetica]AKX96950.1 hypothetical protein MOTHA_c16040 [Moorella thermoacetica]AOQ24260.1 hypothetical protein Maut_01823 [Moorella thermoacetica]OIQ54425.1 hypothetical protein MORE_13940 [Moorella thermoacetica]OIQ58121.1 hypothetical protein MOCA_05460 [Moorella thermoacetica]